MTFKDKLILYLFNKGETIDREFNEHKNYARFHNVDEVDMLETIIRKVRTDLFSEISADIMALISAGELKKHKDKI